MTKTLEQIQEENRKFILSQFEQSLLEANYGTFEEALNNTNLSIYIKENYSFLPLTLSRVLLAIWKSDKYYYKSSFDKDQKEMWFDQEFHALKFGSGVSFDLTKETLEEQSEETQRKINELFTKDS